jgi:nickel/cobalt transporter (NicO) family protein
MPPPTPDWTTASRKDGIVSPELWVLTVTAASLALFHTLLGPDHYLPFVAMARARNWSRTRTTVITFLCGLGHVGSSVLLGAVGILLGHAVTSLVAIETTRAGLAAWGMIVFGFMYMIWGVRAGWRGDHHHHHHHHADGSTHDHDHSHDHGDGHVHVHDVKPADITPWILFTVFVLGPCEPLIPLLMYPAATMSLGAAAFVALVFSVVTIATMLIVVLVASEGVARIPMAGLERWTHALAGAAIGVSGLAVQFLGL